MVPNLFLSNRMDALLERMLEQFDAEAIGPLQSRVILVPNGQMKQWLLLEIAKRKGIAMGLKIVTVAEGIFPRNFPLEMFCGIYNAIRETKDEILLGFLEGKRGRLLSLTGELMALFSTYGQFGKALFDADQKAIDWQHAILQTLFVQGPWRMPVQMLSEMKPPAVYCFGIDSLPPLFWDFLFRASALSIYLFSPCLEFWDDLHTDREQRRLNWREVDAPSFLANWGKLGRETLKIFDRFDLQMEEVYPDLEPNSLLKRVQDDLLHFRTPEKGNGDDSIQVFLTGSSRLREIECLREEILRLEVPYNEISVLAPDIEPYVPLIEFVFADVPYRISGFDLALQSSFRQGLSRLLDLGRWDGEKVLALFETPAFYRKQGWDEDKLETFRTWISGHIKWGLDGKHRKEVLTETLGEKAYDAKGTWEEGLDRLLNAIIYLRPLQVNEDIFEEFLIAVESLKTISLSEERTLPAWSDYLENLAERFLIADLADEADIAAQNAFRQFLYDLKVARIEALFPFAVVQRLLLRPCLGQIHPSHLHAVRFGSMEEGALLPAKALFLIGMDEDHFPRVKMASSLDLLKNKTPDSADRDRYLFLQALFSAEKYLRISYGHLSADEGKPVGPSLLVQELMNGLGLSGTVYRPVPFASPKAECFSWPRSSHFCLPEGEITISLSDLRLLARHPWKFFLQKVHGIYLNEPLDESFALQKGQLLRATLEKPMEEVLASEELPSGPLGEALRMEIKEKAEEWKAQLVEWQLEPFSLIFRENCKERQQEGSNCIVPPIELAFENGLKVRLVGEIKQATNKGLICVSDDSVGGLLKVWPEALAVGVALDAPQIWILKNGKMKAIEKPRESLKAFVEYYFRCLSAPSPLLPDWSDALLRKGAEELEKKIQKGSVFDDPVMDWVMARAEIPAAEQIANEWGPHLKTTFAELAALYPTRKHETV